MPIYEYLCEDCGAKFEKLVRRTVSTASQNGSAVKNGSVQTAEAEAVACPACGQDHTTIQYSTFAPRANGTSKDSLPSCASGMCQTPGLCGRN